MKNWVIWVLLAVPSVGVSATTLSMQNGIELLALNGQKVESKNDSVELLDGKNQIVIRVYKDFPKGSNSELFSSSPYVLTFSEQGQDLKVGLPTRLNDYRKVEKAFRAKTPKFELKAGSTNVKNTSEPLPGSGGFIPYANIEALVADYNKSKGISIESNKVEDLQETAVTVKDNGEIEITGDPLSQLKLWYTKASKEERKAFRKWVIDQE